MPTSVEFDIPFPSRSNPYLEQARVRNLKWMCVHGLVTEETLEYYDASAYTHLVAYVYPEASSATLDLLSRFMGWIALYDDQFDSPIGKNPDKARRAIKGCLYVLNQIPLDESIAAPLDKAFAEIWPELVEGMSFRWRERFVRHWEEYLNAYISEAIIRSRGVVQSFEDYQCTRNSAGAINLSLDLIERAGLFEVPAEIHDLPQMDNIRRNAGRVICYCNDVASFEREVTLDEPVHNSVILLKLLYGYTLDKAIAQIQNLVRRHVEIFLHTANEVRCHYLCRQCKNIQQNVERFIVGVQDWMRGNLDWQVSTARYDSRWRVIRQAI